MAVGGGRWAADGGWRLVIGGPQGLFFSAVPDKKWSWKGQPWECLKVHLPARPPWLGRADMHLPEGPQCNAGWRPQSCALI